MKSSVVFLEQLKAIQKEILQIKDKKRKREKKKLISFCRSLKNDIKINKRNYDNIPENEDFAIKLFNIQSKYNDWLDQN